MGFQLEAKAAINAQPADASCREVPAGREGCRRLMEVLVLPLLHYQ